ncbi:BppU family phage baseplate upper protein [Bacillus thuringiensis]|nr:BppU family phage baseplate upper protein [Bacillus thuringiensis]MED2758718.1 BppU family phage baseplate upper protein [Bacillus thuringiensis]
MRNEVIVIDLADPICTKTIRSRQNDKNGLKLTVHLKENGKIVVLTGYAVKYEAINQRGRFIRDDAKIVDAGKGIFEYILSPEAVSTPAEWLAYFVIEKNHTERTSTPDIRIVLRRDVKEGNIKIENYISEFDKLKKQIDALQQAVDKTDVVKQSGGMMTGYLTMRPTFGSNIGVGFNSEDKVLDIGLVGVADGQLYLKDWKNNKVLFEKSTTGIFHVFADNLLKKSGDTINGLLECKSDNAIVLGSRSYKTIFHKGAQGELIFAPSTKEQGDTWDWSKKVEIRTDGTIKQATDTDWIQMSINTANASNVEGRQVTRAKRNGDQVSVIGSLKNIKEGQVVFNIPIGLRPAQQITDVVIIAGPPYSICEFNIETGGNVRIYNITTDKIIHFSINYLV